MEITQLETNPTTNQAELAAKKQQLQELETKEKELTKSLPLTTQISLLEKEIQTLTNKPTKTKAEERVLESKKKELEELLKKQNNTTETKPNDKIGLYIGCGMVGIVLLLIFILTKNRKKIKK